MRNSIIVALVLLCAQSVFAQNFATQYNGSGYVNCGSSISNTIAAGTKLTLETRFRMTTTPGSWDSPCGTYHSSSWTDGGFGFFYNGSNMNFYIYNYSSNFAAATFNSSNTSWHHLAGTWDKTTGTMNIYLDGVLAGTDSYTGTIGPITADIFQIGAANSQYQWRGQLDEVRVWNIVRTQAEIQSTMNTQLAGNESGLLTYYKMEEGLGTSLTDNSGHGNTGTMTAGVTWVGAPTISFVSPASGHTGSTVTINGNLFTGTTAVTFGGIPASSISVLSDAQLTAVLGPGSTGNIVVNAPGGAASYAGFTHLGTLPVVLVSFTGSCTGNINLLKWTTSCEVNNGYFQLQRGTDGLRFSDIATLSANNNSASDQNYSYQDLNPVKGMNYYRLKQVDINGAITYSKVIAVIQGSNMKQLIAFPNPVSGGQLNLQLAESGLVTIYNHTGGLLYSRLLPAGSNQVDVSRFANGIYNVRCGKENLKVIIQ